jgi:hypothetical protein
VQLIKPCFVAVLDVVASTPISASRMNMVEDQDRRADPRQGQLAADSAKLTGASQRCRKMYFVGFTRQFQHEDWTVVVEDDDRVAYGYLRHDGRIVGDVWLYNRTPAPHRPPWHEPKGEMPFLNSSHYVNQHGSTRRPRPEALSVSWTAHNAPEPQITIYIDNEPIAWLAPGAKPGWSALVQHDGPLAQAKTT